MRLSEIWIYPLKSARGIKLEQAGITSKGLRHDRRWMLVDPAGRFLSQRECPRLALIDVALSEVSLQFRAGGESLELPLESAEEAAESLAVDIWQSRVPARHLAEADSWFSRWLGRPCRLVYLPATTVRPTDPRFARAEVSFADGFPYLLANAASLELLNQQLRAKGQPAVGMERFRPNLVITGAAAFAEDDWAAVRIGSQAFRCVKPCERCVIVNTDQTTGVVGQEPLRTLAALHRRESKVIFGQNLVHDLPLGELRVGQTVECLA